MEKPKTNTGGAVLLKTKGREHFVELAKKRWKKHRAELKEWEKNNKKNIQTATKLKTKTK